MTLTRWRWKVLVAVLALLALLWAFSLIPVWVEKVYSDQIYPLIFFLLGSLTGRLPASLAEIVLGLGLTGLVLYCVWMGRQLMHRKGRRLLVLGQSLMDVLLILLCAGSLFYALWGLNYGRLSLAERVGWGETPTRLEPLKSSLRPLALEVVRLTNQAFGECCPSGGSIPSRPAIPLQEMDLFLNQGLQEAVRRLGLEAPSLGFNRAKPLVASELMSYLGLAGFYFPWTGEANYNGRMLPLEGVHAIAHEKAHQIGFAHEDEANFMGFLACVLSGQPYARYSGYYFADRQLLSLLRIVDSNAWREVSAALAPGVLKDGEQLREFWRPYEGPTQRAATAVNNAHLHLNRVPGGILSYGRSVQLLLQLAAENGNSLEFEP